MQMLLLRSTTGECTGPGDRAGQQVWLFYVKLEEASDQMAFGGDVMEGKRGSEDLGRRSSKRGGLRQGWASMPEEQSSPCRVMTILLILRIRNNRGLRPGNLSEVADLVDGSAVI